MSSHPFSWSVSKVDALRYKRISKIIGGRERWVFMEFVMDKGITVTIDDDEIVSWNHDQKKKACFIRVKDGSIWCYM